MPRVETIVGAVFSISLLTAGSALAGVGGSVAPTYPAGPVRVGDTFMASLTITNDSDGANAGDAITVSNISHTPSCSAATATCAVADPGVFEVSAGTGAPASACAGVTFDVTPVNAATGEVQFMPTTAWTLGPTNNTGGPTICEIQFSVKVLKVPGVARGSGTKVLAQDSAKLAAARTTSLAHALFTTSGDRPQRGMGAGSSATTVAHN